MTGGEKRSNLPLSRHQPSTNSAWHAAQIFFAVAEDIGARCDRAHLRVDRKQVGAARSAMGGGVLAMRVGCRGEGRGARGERPFRCAGSLCIAPRRTSSGGGSELVSPVMSLALYSPSVLLVPCQIRIRSVGIGDVGLGDGRTSARQRPSWLKSLANRQFEVKRHVSLGHMYTDGTAERPPRRRATSQIAE